MRHVAVWITAGLLIFGVFLSYMPAQTIYQRFNSSWDSRVNYTDNPRAQEVYDNLNAATGIQLRTFLYGGVFMIILWAYSSMQRDERYSGVYR